MQSRLLFKIGVSLAVVGVVFVALSFTPQYLFLPANSYWEQRPFVANGGYVYQDLGSFFTQSYVKLDVYAYGGDGKITVQVFNTELTSPITESDISGGGAIIFKAPNNDEYRVLLINTYSTSFQNDKEILIKVYYYFYDLIFLFIGVIMLVLGFSFITYYKFRDKSRDKQKMSVNG